MVSHHFPAWYLGVYPDRRIILASYEADFAAGWGRKARALLEDHGGMFGVEVSASSSAANRWDIQGREGGMVTAGVGGPITGKGADVLLIDDPVKNYEDAHSETMRERAKNWLTSTAYTRLEPNGSVVVVMTRWHESDLAGWALKELSHENWEEIRFPAIAEENDTLGRSVGDALWPERYDERKLERIKKTLGSYMWASLYQQRPAPAEGGMFKRAWFGEPVKDAPARGERVRSWDKGGGGDGSDPSAGVRMMRAADGVFYIEDVQEGRWGSYARETIIQQTAATDTHSCGTQPYSITLQQDPGQAGKSDIEYSVKRLAGYHVVHKPVTGSKETRARPLASQAEAGNVKLVDGPWVRRFLDQITMFPNAEHDDIVDAASDALNYLTLRADKKAVFF